MLCPFITLLSDTPAMQQLSHYRLSDSLYTSLYMACPKDMPLTPYAQTLYTMMSNRFRAMTGIQAVKRQPVCQFPTNQKAA